jgi:hypothetical protein
MRTIHKTAACIISLLFLIATPLICRGEASLTVFGVGSIESTNLARAEQRALDDAFAKAVLQASLRYVPGSSIADLVQLLPGYTSSRGMQDILQYQITSRTQQDDMLLLSVDVKLDDDSLRQWLHDHVLTIPRELRSRVLLAISFLGPGNDKPYEWWTAKGDTSYSSFESQFARELKHHGECILDPPKKSKNVHDQSNSLEAALAARADVLITGSIAYTPVLDTLYECSLELSLVDVASRSVLSSWSVSLRGDFSTKAMNSLMIDEVIKPVRAGISKRILKESPGVAKKTLCVEGISDYVTYQSMINALKAVEGVSRISITGIHGHSICHVIEIKGSLFDAMENLKRRQIARADILVENEAAYIRILKK